MKTNYISINFIYWFFFSEFIVCNNYNKKIIYIGSFTVKKRLIKEQ